MSLTTSAAGENGIPTLGDRLGAFELIREIPSNGAWVAFHAEHTERGSSVTLKLLPRALTDAEAFLREAPRLMASLQRASAHGVEPILAMEQTPSGQWVLVSPESHGQSLFSRLRSGPLATDEAVSVMRKVLAVVAAAHDVGIRGCDIMAESTWLMQDGSVRLTDVGLSQVLIRMGCLDSKPGELRRAVYTAPEHLRGDAPSVASDMFSAGVLLVELISGRLPTSAQDAATVGSMHAASGFELPLPAKFRRHPLGAVIRKACHPDPTKRFASAAEFGTQLAEVPLESVPPQPSLARVAGTVATVSTLVGTLVGAVNWLWPRVAPSFCAKALAVVSGTALNGTLGFMCDSVEPETPTMRPEEVEARATFLELRPRIFDCVMAEVQRRQMAPEGSAEALGSGLFADLQATDPLVEGSAGLGSGSGGGVGSGSGTGQQEASGEPAGAPSAQRGGQPSASQPNAVAAAHVSPPTSEIEPAPPSDLETIKAQLGHLEVLVVPDATGSVSEVVVPHTSFSAEARACVTAAASPLRFPVALAGQQLVKSYWLFGAVPPNSPPDQVQEAVISQQLDAKLLRAEHAIASCLRKEPALASTPATPIDGRLWFSASGQSALFEVAAPLLGSEAQRCVERGLADISTPASSRIHSVTLAWNCTVGETGTCVRDGQRPLTLQRSNATF